MDAPEGFVGVRLGGIVRFFPLPASPQPVEGPVDDEDAHLRTGRAVRAPGRCQDCGNRVWRRSVRCTICHRLHARSLAREKSALRQTYRTLEQIIEANLAQHRWIVCECGCLIRPQELCPACVIPWIRAHDHVDDVAYYQPQKTLEERRAA